MYFLGCNKWFNGTESVNNGSKGIFYRVGEVISRQKLFWDKQHFLQNG
jgi:hypothetical protein